MDIQTTHFAHNLQLTYLKEDKIIGGEVAHTGKYEPYESSLMLSFLEEGDVAVDIGANIGVITLQLAQKVGDRGLVYAFEPEPANAQLLRKNITDNDLKNIEVFELALSDVPGEAKLYLSWDNLGDHRIYDAHYRRHRHSIAVEKDTLDTILLKKVHEQRPVKLLKSDTQGFEPFVLKGASRLVERDHPVLFMEYWPFGYSRSHGDKEAMLDFLLDQYNEAYVIDGWNEKLLPLVRETLDDFTKNPGEREGHRNLLFIH